MRYRFCVTAILLTLMAVSPVHAQKNCPFTGNLDFRKKELTLNVSPASAGSLTLTVNQAAQDNYNLSLSMDHWKAPGLDISTQLKSLIAVMVDPENSRLRMTGDILSQYTLVNYKPVRELSGNFHFENRVLYLDSLAIGGIRAGGKLELISPFKMDVSLNLKEIRMDDFLKFWGAQDDLRSDGFVSGNIHVTGAIGSPFLKGTLESRDGFVDELHYSSIILNVAGAYPVLYLNDSSVAQSDGMAFNLEGPFNLANRDHFDAEVAGLRTLPVISENAQAREWTLKRDGEASGGELKYIMRNEKENNVSRQGSDLMGVQRSIKF